MTVKNKKVCGGDRPIDMNLIFNGEIDLLILYLFMSMCVCVYVYLLLLYNNNKRYSLEQFISAMWETQKRNGREANQKQTEK